MNPEILAALITLLGTLVLLAIGNLITTAFFAGKTTQRLDNVVERVVKLEKSDRENTLGLATLRGRLGGEEK
jgi:hypothetical protein